MMLCTIKIFMLVASINLMEAKGSVSWTFHNNKYCPQGYRYDSYYSRVKDAQNACLADPTCGFVYDRRCDDTSTTHNIQLCKTFPSSELISHAPDCVYELERIDTCYTELVSGHEFNIPDKSMTASSKWSAAYGPENARLNKKGSWIALSSDKDPWIQGTFDKQFKVTAIQTQSRHAYHNWVKTYKITYSENGADWKVIKNENGSEHVFMGNTDYNSVVTNTLHQPLDNIKSIRIWPQTWEGSGISSPSLRFEILGCVTKEVSYRTPLKNGGCAVSMTKFHERCHCVYADMNICESYCDTDDNCKGYAGSLTKEPYCHFATTSKCPPGCSKYDTGDVRELIVDMELYPDVYSGCYIKNT